MGDFSHCFAISAYGESPYLESCVRSLLAQSIPSKIIMTTSTPNDLILSVSENYHIPLYIRKAVSDIRSDWNFAYDQACADYVTIAHQDDIYSHRYLERFKKKVEYKDDKEWLIYFTDYVPLRHGIMHQDYNSIIKKFLKFPLRLERLSGIRKIKKATLSFGNSICCPTVTYNKRKLGNDIFTSDMSFNIDWDTFYKLALLDGKFLYDSYVGLAYRVHDGATTAGFIKNKTRQEQDIAMFCKFWPEMAVRVIMVFYKMAYNEYL